MKALPTILAALSLIGSIFADEVTVEGRAAGDLPNARETALADALREAVRQGTGVDVLGSSGTADFTLDYDRVLGAAFGHVRSYRVLGSRLGEDGIYRVKVSADVEKGAPHAKNRLAMRELLMRKNSPRLSVRIDGAAGDHATALIEDAARELQIQTVPPGAPCEFEIVGKISLHHTGRQTLHGASPQNIFSARGSLQVLRSDTGDIVATDNLAAQREVGSPVLEIPDAERDALERALRPQESDGIPPVLGKVIARWVAETDLGATKRIELSGIDPGEFQQIATSLAGQDKISAVWPREFNAYGASVIDVETRLDSAALAATLVAAGGGKIAIDRSTENFLQASK